MGNDVFFRTKVRRFYFESICIHMKKNSKFKSLRWENISEEHMDILKHLKSFEVMCVCVYFLFLSTPSSDPSTCLYRKVH